MTYLLDTNICIHFLNSSASVLAERILEAGPNPLLANSVTMAELRFGAARPSQPEANRRQVETLDRELAVADLAYGAHFGKLKEDALSRARPIP